MSADRIVIDTAGSKCLILVSKNIADPAQTDLFDTDSDASALREYYQIAERFNGPFYPSEIRALMQNGFSNGKKYGSAAKGLTSRGYVMLPERSRKSMIGTRKGGREFMWCKNALMSW